MAKIKPAGKVLIVTALAAVLSFGYFKFKDQLIPEGEKAEDVSGLMADMSDDSDSKATPAGNNKCLEIGVVTWGGYAGGQYWNNGFKTNSGSRFEGVCVNFTVMDDFNASRAAFKSGKMDLMWVTMDAFSTEAGNYGEPVKFLFQADWSRGGDAIVTTSSIASVGDLANKKIAVAPATPSHTFLLWMLDMAGLSFMDVEIIEVASAIDAAAQFKAGKVDAAVVWSPDDADCVQSVSGAKVLTNTKQATHIIADGFMVKQSTLSARKTELKALVEGWLKGSAEINSDSAAKAKAAKILAKGLDQPESFTSQAIDNVRLTTYGDNLDFFGLNPEYTNVTGEDLYTKMAKVYKKLRLANNVPSYPDVIDTGFIKSLDLDSAGAAVVKAEEKVEFSAPTVQDKTAKAVASKPVRVNFDHGSTTLDPNAQTLIDLQFVEAARAFPSSRIRIEGNTDSTGSAAANRSISQQRAQAVVDYLVQKGFDKNRFVVVGNGPSKPLCTDTSPACLAKNRRTDFQILEN